MNGNKYGAESWTIVPIIFTLPQLSELFPVKLNAFNACGKMSSITSVELFKRLFENSSWKSDSSATVKHCLINAFIELIKAKNSILNQ